MSVHVMKAEARLFGGRKGGNWRGKSSKGGVTMEENTNTV